VSTGFETLLGSSKQNGETPKKIPIENSRCLMAALALDGFAAGESNRRTIRSNRLTATATTLA
jgi:hypothetical protein